MRPRLLDLFCGDGGAAMGYHRAGFEVIGVDLAPHPDYPFEFHQGDAMAWPLDGYDVVHASPPCPLYAATKSLHPGATHPDLLGPTIDRLQATGLPFVVENVEGAPYPADLFRLMLCGSSFGLRVRRHRWFVSNMMLMGLPCEHARQLDLVGVYGHSSGADGRNKGPRQATTDEARDAMGMPWATKRKGITNAIPPAYTEHLGRQLLGA